MAPGQYVFGPNRVGLWIIPVYTDGLFDAGRTADKLRHVLPRARQAIPNLTDIFLPPEVSRDHVRICRESGFFVSTYDVAHSTPADVMAKKMLLKRRDLGTGAIEIDLEGAAVQPDLPALKNWATLFVQTVRKTNPNLPVRLNVTPFKGYAVPVALINSDPHLHVIVQAYFGNQDGRLSESDLLEDMLDWGVRREKVQIMYGVLADNPQNQRVYALPNPAYKPITKGSVFSDNLLIDAGVLS